MNTYISIAYNFFFFTALPLSESTSGQKCCGENLLDVELHWLKADLLFLPLSRCRKNITCVTFNIVIHLQEHLSNISVLVHSEREGPD